MLAGLAAEAALALSNFPDVDVVPTAMEAIGALHQDTHYRNSTRRSLAIL